MLIISQQLPKGMLKLSARNYYKHASSVKCSKNKWLHFRMVRISHSCRSIKARHIFKDSVNIWLIWDEVKHKHKVNQWYINQIQCWTKQVAYTTSNKNKDSTAEAETVQ